MINEPPYDVTQAMVDDELLKPIDKNNVDGFVTGEGLHLLFFTGGKSVRRENHDVAVALRELLKDYQGLLTAGVIVDDGALQKRFRASATPSLVFLSGGEVLEVLPRVRDWAEYATAFARYLGPVPQRAGAVA